VNRFRLQKDYGPFTLDAAASWSATRMALFGASGSGKTTILEALAGVRPEVSGEVTLAGQRLDRLPARERRVGWVPQDAALFPHLSVARNVDFAERGRAGGDETRRALQALEIEHLVDRRPGELSGGERQRVAIARALASRPRVLLLDEPTASIDRPLRARILPFLRELPERAGIPLVIVTHDPLEVVALAEHVAVIERGRIVREGPPASVFASAVHFGALFALGAENRFDVRVVGRKDATLCMETARGTPLSAVASAGFPEPDAVAVRAEDVMLAAGDPGRVSAQNVLSGVVRRVEPVGEQLYAVVDVAGETWRAKVTAGAVQSLELAPGRTVRLLIKAHAVLPAS